MPPFSATTTICLLIYQSKSGDIMKSTSLLLSALALGTVKAAVVDTQTAAVDPQAAASKRIEVLEKQYQKYILDTIKTRERGCTNSSILVRQEWLVSSALPVDLLLTHYLYQGLSLQG